MAGMRSPYNEKKIEQRIKEGRGQGEGAGYTPWIKVGEFGSKGRSHRLLGIKTGRMHHFFSDLEAKYFYLLEWSEDVVDIREQYPLFPVSDTERIAAEINVRHPKVVGSRISNVMTTDFLITTRRENEIALEARSVKYSRDLENARTMEKQAIEKEFWSERGIPWKLVTEASVPAIRVKNIKKLLGYYSPPLEDVLSDRQREALTKEWIEALAMARGTLGELASILDARYDLAKGNSLTMFYHLAARKIVPVRIDVKLQLSTKVASFVDIAALENRLALESSGDNYEYHA